MKALASTENANDLALQPPRREWNAVNKIIVQKSGLECLQATIFEQTLFIFLRKNSKFEYSTNNEKQSKNKNQIEIYFLYVCVVTVLL